jgi:hypothetical protein
MGIRILDWGKTLTEEKINKLSRQNLKVILI